MATNKFYICVFSLAAVTLASQPAWAVYSPDPQSGGRFFPGKGTQEGVEYVEYIENPENLPSYGRTETGIFDRHHYAKGLKLGIVQVRPSLGYTGEFDSNIFLTERDRKSDYINRLVAGVDTDVLMDGGKYVLTGGVQSESEWFAKHNNQNHGDWAYQLGGEVHLSAIDLTVHEDFRNTTARTGSELTDRIKRYENRLRGLATIPLGQVFSETEVTDFVLDFRNNNALDRSNRHEFSVYPRFGVNIGSRTQALLEYGYTDINYENQGDRDGAAHQGQLGIRGFLGDADLMAYQLWAGAQFRHYDDGSLNTFDGFVGHGELIYRPNIATRLILQALRRPEESLDGGQPFYTRNEVNVQIKRQVAQQWFVNGRVGSAFSHYSSDRLDFLWEPGVGVEYVLPGKMVALFAEYKFSARESDTVNRDYDRHIANFGIRAEI